MYGHCFGDWSSSAEKAEVVCKAMRARIDAGRARMLGLSRIVRALMMQVDAELVEIFNEAVEPDL